MRKLVFLLLGVASVAAVKAQSEGSAFTATGRAGVSVSNITDYQSLGINPANLGRVEVDPDNLSNEKKFSLGLAEVAISVTSDALEKPELRENFFSVDAFRGAGQLSTQDKIDAAQAFAEAGVSINIDAMLLGFAVQPNRDVGGFAFSVRDRFSGAFRFNELGAGIIFQGYNYAPYFDSVVVSGSDTTGYSTAPQYFSQVFQGSRLQMNWYRELNLGYGRYLLDDDNYSLYAGIGVKYLMGIGYLDVNVEEGFHAFSALGPVFGIEYGSASTGRNVTDGGAFTSVGSGFGFDFGINFCYGMEEQLKIGIALTDIGSINWDGNVYTADDTLFNGLSDHGIDSYNFFAEGQEIAGDSGFFQWQGAEKVKTNLPTRLRTGVSYRLNDKFEFGADLVIPMNDAVGNFEDFMFGLGGDFRPTDFFRVSSGFSFSKQARLNVPIGIYFSAPNKAYEMGIASRDAITFFTSERPTLSLAMGLLRFKF